MIRLPRTTADAAAQDLRYRVALFLMQHGLQENGRVAIEADRGVVTLTGHVPSFRQRKLSELFARRVAGVLQVINELDVLPGNTAHAHHETTTVLLRSDTALSACTFVSAASASSAAKQVSPAH